MTTMNLSFQKAYALRKAIEAVADSLDARRTFAKYNRFNDYYNESKEANIEWLEALLTKLTSIESGHYPAIGYLSHVGRLLEEYSKMYSYEDIYHLGYDVPIIYLAYMEYFVADGTLAESLSPAQIDTYNKQIKEVCNDR